MSKSNTLVKYLKNINKYINSLLEKNLNKLKLSNFIKLAKSNKSILTFVAVIFIFLSYLLIPTFYKQGEISKEIKNELLNNYNLNFKFSKDLNYNFFPRPHFISNEAKIVVNQENISEIKKIKIYVSLENLLSLKNIKINEVIIQEANFNLNKKNSNFFIKLLDNNFTQSSFKIKDSNIFFRNKKNEVLLINKIVKMKYFYDPNELKNIIYSENEIFNMPYLVEIIKNENEKKYFSKLNFNFLNLKIESEHNYKNEAKSGFITFFFNKSKSIASYQFKKNIFEFDLFDKFENANFTYNGKINFKPFYSSLKGNAIEQNFAYLFDVNSIIPQLLKTEILNNKNIELKLNINANKILNFNSFMNIILNARVSGGLIDIDGSSFKWKNYASFKLLDSLIYVKNGELLLDGKSQIIVNDYNEIYKFLVTPKNLRKKINIIDLNYIYNFDQKVINLDDIRIDNKFDNNINKIIKNITIKNNVLQNKIYLKNLLNKIIKSYSG